VPDDGANSIRRTGDDLHLELPVDPPGGLRAGLMEALRDAVRTGRLVPGTRLPSSRSLAADLGVARNTVADAYAELVAEGWLTARQGSGTAVAARESSRRAAGSTRPRPRDSRPRHDLRPGRPDVAAFPRAAWLRATRKALASAPDAAFDYNEPSTSGLPEEAATKAPGRHSGRVELRTALADYLARARGVRADPDRIVVCAGVAHGLSLLAAALRARKVRAVAVEGHGLPVHRELLGALRTPALPLDDRGARTEELAGLPGVGAVLLTPAHQFPTGAALHPDRRAGVVDWARAAGAFVLEDDYDGEFRYDRQPVGALQGLDPEHVVFLGTASKALAPGLRLGWMVLPEALLGEVDRQRLGTGVACGVVEQLALAEFLDSGGYDRHVRAMRLAYRRRRDELVAALAERAPEVRVRGLAAGLHALLELPDGAEQDALRSAARHQLAVHGLGSYRRPGADPLPDALVVGYATPSASAWPGALDTLCHALAPWGS
jgi:GntR family transcriptional regulator/MocR family aminotransferase